MITPDERSLLVGYQQDFLKRTGKAIKFTECSKWEQIAHFSDTPLDFYKMADLICDFTGWDRRFLFERVRKEEAVFRRAVVDFIAVNNGVSLVKIGRQTDRNHTTVINSINSLEDRLNTTPYLGKLLREIVQNLKEHYPDAQAGKASLRAV